MVFKLFAGVCPAFADAIDGQWCLGSSRVEKWTEDADAGENEITDNDDRHGLDDVVGKRGGRRNADRDGVVSEETVRLTRGTTSLTFGTLGRWRSRRTFSRKLRGTKRR